MKGDFSRWTFDARNHYTAVLMQEGRVQLDSDWNEQAAMLGHLERTRLEDVVGSCGVPGGLGFEVYTGADGAPMLSAGRIYAGGLACELAAETPISHVTRTPLRPEAGRTDLVYLDAWERHVTALDAPDLVEVALGGPDTSTRLQVAWAIDVIEDVGSERCAESSAALPKQGLGRMTAEAPYGYLGTENQLYRVEIHDGGSLGEATFKWSRHNGSVLFPVERFLGPRSAQLGAPSSIHRPFPSATGSRSLAPSASSSGSREHSSGSTHGRKTHERVSSTAMFRRRPERLDHAHGCGTRPRTRSCRSSRAGSCSKTASGCVSEAPAFARVTTGRSRPVSRRRRSSGRPTRRPRVSSIDCVPSRSSRGTDRAPGATTADVPSYH
jgi:hypothetical protein